MSTASVKVEVKLQDALQRTRARRLKKTSADVVKHNPVTPTGQSPLDPSKKDSE